jgi:hypothetical protein
VLRRRFQHRDVTGPPANEELDLGRDLGDYDRAFGLDSIGDVS